MAIRIIEQPGQLSLSGNLKKVKLQAGPADTHVPFHLYVTDPSGTADPEEILSQVYYPDSNGSIVIDLSSIIQDRLLFDFRPADITQAWQQSMLARTFYFTAGNSGPSDSFTVIRAGIDNMQETAAVWLATNFLTWQPTIKHVTYSTPEFLTYYAQDDCTVKVRIYYPDGSDPTDYTLAELSEGAWTIPVSYSVIAALLELSTPEQLAAADHLPGAYDVWVEDSDGTHLTYIQRYMASSMRENEQWVLFENSLGGIDCFRAYGQGTVQAEYQHQLANQDTDTTEYRVDTQRLQLRSTGWMDKAQRRWMLDFFPASRRWICQDGVFRTIILTDDSVSYTLDNMPAEFEFTFRYTSNLPYLNMSRLLTLPSVMDIQAPDMQSFTVPPRLVEFPRIGPSEGALIPAQSPYSDNWAALSLSELIEYIGQAIIEGGHTHPNKLDLDKITTDSDFYLWLTQLVNGVSTRRKVRAGDSDQWSGHQFSDYLDQAVRQNDAVRFAQLLAGYIHSTGDITANGGVSAMGISDLSISPTGTANLDVVSMADLSDETYEDLNRVPSAYSVKQMMEHIGIDRLTEFDDEEEYSRGDAVRHNGKGYRFNTHKSKGAWDPSYCDRVDYLTLLSPLEVTNDFIDSLSI